MKSTFLTAEWRKLAIINYSVDPSILSPYIPYGTELDYWNGKCYVSLVGFRFINTKLKGIRHSVKADDASLTVAYGWKHNGDWDSITLKAEVNQKKFCMDPSSERSRIFFRINNAYRRFENCRKVCGSVQQ